MRSFVVITEDHLAEEHCYSLLLHDISEWFMLVFVIGLHSTKQVYIWGGA
jgi:hypothetical protein